jgi:transcriptional regulator with XRE-family HTH domain
MGRPSHKPTHYQRERVMRLRADGWSLERIARVIGLDVQTLAKHYGDELEHGADIKTDALLEWAERGAKKGNAANIKWLSERYQAARADEQLRGRASGPPAEEPKAPKLGKKEQQQEAANAVKGKYATPPAPKLH